MNRRLALVTLVVADYDEAIAFYVQKLGFTLKEIRELLSLRVTAGKSCADVRDLAHQKLAAVDAKLAELQRVRTALADLAEACTGSGPTSECPFLDALDAQGDANGHR